MICYDTFGFPVELDLGPEGKIHCFNTKVDAPAAPTKDATQQALEAEQLSSLRDQRSMTKGLMPYVLSNLGLKDDGSGGYARLSQEEKDALLTTDEKADQDLSRTIRQREADALGGKLAISPGLTKSLDEQQTTQEEILKQKLGKDWQLSTAGIKNQDTQLTRRNLIEEEARRGMIGEAQGLLNQNESRITNTANTKTQMVGATPGQWNSVIGNYGNVIAPMQAERMTAWDMKNKASMQSSANSAALSSGLMSMLGQGAGAAAFLSKGK